MNSTAVPPRAVRTAGLLVVAQGASALAVAVLLVLRGLAGADERVVNGYGTAGWFLLVGAAVLGAGWLLRRGRQAGRGIAVFANLTLLPIAWYLGAGSHRWGYAALVGGAAVAVLGLLFSPAAVRWAAQRPAPTGSS